MQDLVLFVAKSLADQPDKVDVTAAQEGGELKLTLKVAEVDKGKIIGKKGRVIRAMRALVSYAASRTGKKVSLDVE